MVVKLDEDVNMQPEKHEMQNLTPSYTIRTVIYLQVQFLEIGRGPLRASVHDGLVCGPGIQAAATAELHSAFPKIVDGGRLEILGTRH